MSVVADGRRGADPTEHVVLALDAGNSKTDIAVVAADGCLLATVSGPGFRGEHEEMSIAVTTLAEHVEPLLAELGTRPVDHVAACLANADLPIEEEWAADSIRERGWGAEVSVRNDTFAVLRAGARQHWGVAVVCGEGINCVGVSPDGAVARFPSLGRISGDWGGGACLGNEALWWAARAEDGRGEPTRLVEAVASHFGYSTVLEVTTALHFGELPSARLSELSPVLVKVASDGDRVAGHIVDHLAEEVATLGITVLHRLSLLDRPVEVVLGGGVLRGRDERLMTGIAERYARRAPHAELVVIDAPPVLGAALLGLDAIGAGPAAERRLRTAYRSADRLDPETGGGQRAVQAPSMVSDAPLMNDAFGPQR